MKILEFIKQTIGKSLPIVLIKLCDAVKSISAVILTYNNEKNKKEKIKNKKQAETKIDNIANNGTIDDLLDLGRGHE